MLEFDFNHNERILTCLFKGRLDTILCIQISPELESKYISLCENEDKEALLDFALVFDLREVSFISSSFIRLCLAGKKRVKEGNFSILNSDPFIMKTFKIAGLDEILSVE
ncbi:MAG: anti-sigma factor antagonist [Bacteroidetes bacterium]|nr:MAG: anti-sigma factor antagonist [Bacteroidota bacterium]